MSVSDGGTLPPPGTPSKTSRYVHHILSLPGRTGKPHIYRRRDGWWISTGTSIQPMDWWEPEVFRR